MEVKGDRVGVDLITEASQIAVFAHLQGIITLLIINFLRSSYYDRQMHITLGRGQVIKQNWQNESSI